jgi:hypothetical protein
MRPSNKSNSIRQHAISIINLFNSVLVSNAVGGVEIHGTPVLVADVTVKRTSRKISFGSSFFTSEFTS